MRHTTRLVSAGQQAESAAAPGTRFAALIDAIRIEPWHWDYFQALRCLDAFNPQQPRLGSATRPADESIRLGQDPALTFAPSSLSALVPGKEGRPPRLEVRFFGLLGPNGPLPLHLSEQAYSRQLNAGDATMARFADVIHHRFLSLFYRAWAQAQPAVSLDRPREDRFGTYVASLAGLGLETLRERDALPDHAKLSHAGLLSRQVRNAEGLENLLADHFETTVTVEPFVGHWMTLRERDCSRLGRGARLARDAIAGGRVWDRQHKFRLHIGPLSLVQYESLLPGSAGYEVLRAALRNYVGLELDWDARLLLRADQLPPVRLGAGQRLGYTSWLGQRAGGAGQQPAADLVLDAQRAVSRLRAESVSPLHHSQQRP